MFMYIYIYMTIYLHHLRVLKTCACNCHVRNLVPETRRAFQGRGDVEGRPESNGQHDGWPLGGDSGITMDHHKMSPVASWIFMGR